MEEDHGKSEDHSAEKKNYFKPAEKTHEPVKEHKVHRKKKKRGFYILYIVILIIIAFAVAEVSFRVMFPETMYEQIDKYPVPYMEFTGEPNGDFCSQGNCEVLNDWGFRGELPEMPKGDEYRIFLVGGSVVHNGKNAIGEDISKMVESNLRGFGVSNAVVYNFGMGSYNSAQELSLLMHWLVDYQPDMVIALDGANELQTYLYDPRPNYPYNFLIKQSAYLDIKNIDDMSGWNLFGMLLRKSRVVDKLFGHKIDEEIFNTPELREEIGYGSDMWKQEIVVSYVNNILKMKGISEMYDFKFVSILQPIVIYKEPLVDYEEELYYTAYFYQDVYDAFDHYLSQLSVEEGYYYDFRDIFDGYEEELYTDFVHVNKEGDAIIAQRIAEAAYSHI